jgi:sec-independent protein translocase protein TatA
LYLLIVTLGGPTGMFGKTEELLIVLLIVLLLFGAKKLPELARSMGQSVKEVRKGFSDDIEEPTKSKSSKKA